MARGDSMSCSHTKYLELSIPSPDAIYSKFVLPFTLGFIDCFLENDVLENFEKTATIYHSGYMLLPTSFFQL